jgi:hypothetical protein
MDWATMCHESDWYVGVDFLLLLANLGPRDRLRLGVRGVRCVVVQSLTLALTLTLTLTPLLVLVFLAALRSALEVAQDELIGPFKLIGVDPVDRLLHRGLCQDAVDRGLPVVGGCDRFAQRLAVLELLGLALFMGVQLAGEGAWLRVSADAKVSFLAGVACLRLLVPLAAVVVGLALPLAAVAIVRCPCLSPVCV